MINGLKKNIVKAKIDGMEFIRVTNFNSNEDIINTKMYLKVNKSYKLIMPNEVPYDVANKLSLDKSYSLMNETEIKSFIEGLSKLNKDIINKNKFADFEVLNIENILDTTYLLLKEKDVDYYVLYAVLINELGVLKGEYPIPSNELSFILADIIDKDNSFENRTFLIHENLFVHVKKDGDKYTLCILKFNRNDDSTITIEIIGIFFIINTDGKYEILLNETMLERVTDEERNEIVNEFSNNIKIK